MDKREEFLKRIQVTYLIEAEEGIQNISSNVIEMEKNPPESRMKELIEATFREAHSLKGASRAVNKVDIEAICQALESVFSALKNNQLSPTNQLFNLFHTVIDLLEELIKLSSADIGLEWKKRCDETIFQLLDAVKTPSKEQQIRPTPSPANQEPLPSIENNRTEEKTIRVSITKLDDLLFQASELLSIKQNLKQNLKDISRIIQDFNIHPQPKKLEDELRNLKKSAQQDLYESTIKIDNYTDEIKKIVSVPFSTMLDVFPKACRDLSRDLGKNVELNISGDDVEIDRRILELFRNPLMHLLRNSIDHGIEKPAYRKSKGKPEMGQIHFSIARLENSKVEIRISDDGAGIDLEKLRKLYLNRKMFREQEAPLISEAVLLDFMFHSGVSTQEMITDLSGRGLGLAIVREKMEELGGEVFVHSKLGLGTEFIIILPLSLISFRGIHIRCGAYEFIIPTLKISKVLRQRKNEIRTVEGKRGIMNEETFLPFFNMSDLLELPFGGQQMEWIPSLIVGKDENRIVLAVDEILDEEEILVKRFNKHLAKVMNISGATVLSSGKVVPILNVDDLIHSAGTNASVFTRDDLPEEAIVKKSILVVEDSITSRMLLKNILESAGYEVTTAVDGLDGFSKLKVGDYKLVVSDVDMPRLNGFDLTAKIRADKNLNDKPVILVTSLSKEEDRERGMMVGANAYIIKSSFDQSNLLEVIDRLI